MATYAINWRIRRQIAAAMVRESHPGHDRQRIGHSYAVDMNDDGELDAVMFRESTAQWNPWPDSAVAIPITALYEGRGVDFSEIEEGFEDDAIAVAASELPQDYEEVPDAESIAALMAEAAEVQHWWGCAES